MALARRRLSPFLRGPLWARLLALYTSPDKHDRFRLSIRLFTAIVQLAFVN